MKLLFFPAFLTLILSLSAKASLAQQAKAYETVKYNATTKSAIFYLDYADGYIGASKIWLNEKNHKKQLLLPESGAAELNGNFVLHSEVAADKSKVILKHINEEREAPETIRADYRATGRNIALVFYRTKK